MEKHRWNSSRRSADAAILAGRFTLEREPAKGSEFLSISYIVSLLSRSAVPHKKALLQAKPLLAWEVYLNLVIAN